MTSKEGFKKRGGGATLDCWKGLRFSEIGHKHSLEHKDFSEYPGVNRLVKERSRNNLQRILYLRRFVGTMTKDFKVAQLWRQSSHNICSHPLRSLEISSCPPGPRFLRQGLSTSILPAYASHGPWSSITAPSQTISRSHCD